MLRIARVELEELFLYEDRGDLLRIIAPEVFIALLSIVNNPLNSMKKKLPRSRRGRFYNTESTTFLAGDHLGL